MDIIRKIQNLNILELEELLNVILNILNVSKEKKGTVLTSNILESKHNICCPHCGSIRLRKNGHTRTGIQKYHCADCKKSSSPTTNTIFFSSKSGYDVWRKFIKCELNHLTLEESADECKISKNSAFNMRHKLYYALGNFMTEHKLNDRIELDSLYFTLNFKGLKKKMPRKPKLRKTVYDSTNLYLDKLCVTSGVDEADNMCFKVTNLGKETNESYKSIYSFIESPKYLVTDNYLGFETIANDLNTPVIQVLSDLHSNLEGENLNTLNQLHSELRNHMSIYKGVSSRHLQEYLNFFVFFKYLKYKFEKSKKTIEFFTYTTKQLKKITRKEIYEIPFPFDIDQIIRDYEIINEKKEEKEKKRAIEKKKTNEFYSIHGSNKSKNISIPIIFGL